MKTLLTATYDCSAKFEAIKDEQKDEQRTCRLTDQFKIINDPITVSTGVISLDE